MLEDVFLCQDSALWHDRSQMNVGIQQIQVYLPSQRVAKQDAVPFSKYPTKEGDADESLTVLPIDEDVISMALTVVRDLMERTGLGWDEIGMIQVGTSTNLDRTKPIQSYICAMFNEHGVYDLIGGDNTFACNAGMNALMHVASWMGSPLWNGKLGLVVTADFSHTATAIRSPYDRVWNGAAACAAVLVPDGPLKIDRYSSRTCHNFSSIRPAAGPPYRSFPDAGGASAFAEFYASELCQVVQTWKQNHRVDSIADSFDYFAVHDVTPSRVRKSFDSILEADGANSADHLEKLSPSLRFFQHTQHVGVSNVLLYLAGIVTVAGTKAAADARLFCLGEGSNFQTSILTLHGDLTQVSVNDVQRLLDEARQLTWWEYHDQCESHLQAYGRPRSLTAQKESESETATVRIASTDRGFKRRYQRLTADSKEPVKWPGPIFRTVAGSLLIFDFPLFIVPVIMCSGFDVREPEGWIATLNIVFAVSTLIWRGLAFLFPGSLYPELTLTTPYVASLYKLNLRSFSFFAIGACIWTLTDPTNMAITIFWLAYFGFRQLNMLVSLRRNITELYLHDALVMLCYLDALQVSRTTFIAALLVSVGFCFWHRLSRRVLSWIAK